MNILAIGGGENGRPGTQYETKKLDEEIVRMTGKEKPNLLFIAFTQKSAEGAENYYEIIKRNFSNLGCNCEHLREVDVSEMSIVKQKISNADIIYVGGGNTLRLMNMLRKHKINALLKEAGEKGTVLCGVSAGAICWCNYGNSDSRKFTSNSTQLIKVTGLGFIPVLFCPHFDAEGGRQADLKRMMKTTKGVSVAFENCTALQIKGNVYKVLKINDQARAWKCYWSKGQYVKHELNLEGSLEELSIKN